jgi:hypothetical protein
MKTSLPLFARLCGALVLATASVACSGVASSDAAPAPAPRAPVTAAAPAAPSAPSASHMDQLKAEIGAAACDNSQQCKTVAVGSKACGGPEGYLPYSTKRSDSAKVSRLAAADAAQRKAADQRAGMVSNCMMIMDPGAVCTAGKCVKGGAVES